MTDQELLPFLPKEEDIARATTLPELISYGVAAARLVGVGETNPPPDTTGQGLLIWEEICRRTIQLFPTEQSLDPNDDIA